MYKYSDAYLNRASSFTNFWIKLASYIDRPEKRIEILPT